MFVGKLAVGTYQISGFQLLDASLVFTFHPHVILVAQKNYVSFGGAQGILVIITKIAGRIM